MLSYMQSKTIGDWRNCVDAAAFEAVVRKDVGVRVPRPQPEYFPDLRVGQPRKLMILNESSGQIRLDELVEN